MALQFPDELIADSSLVAEELQKLVSSSIYVLGDTSYAGCVVVAAAAAADDDDVVAVLLILLLPLLLVLLF